MNTKTVAIRLDEDVHAQLVIIAQLSDTTLTEEIRLAVEARIVARKKSGDLSAKAGAVLEDIERDAATRREAIESLFGDRPTKSGKSSGRTRQPKRPSGTDGVSATS